MLMVFKEITFHETCFACFRHRLVTRPEAAETNPTGAFPRRYPKSKSHKEGTLRE